MYEIIFRFYGLIHRYIKLILKRNCQEKRNRFYMTEQMSIGIKEQEIDLWQYFIDNSTISEKGYFTGLHYAGYISEKKEWCLTSWIWTNAAIVRMYCVQNDVVEAEKIAKILESWQTESGGWIVRNDYDSNGAIPVLAPNDSSYIANNAFITLYKKTKDSKYLNIAKDCADWVMQTSRVDGMVYTGYNMRDQNWIKDNIIVDVGFTAGLFASLYEITKEEKYRAFLEKFIYRYIELFYNPILKAFCTSIDKNDKQQGGLFGRGQAWALEGLIPAYKVLGQENIKHIIEDTIKNLIKLQCKDGSWSYNLAKPLMGRDCKGVPIIAKNMMEWYLLNPLPEIKESAMKAYKWCLDHTCNKGEALGGIFSYSVEGAIVKDLYTSCAFVYSSAYAIELHKVLML